MLFRTIEQPHGYTMSDHWIGVIPRQPTFVPTEAAIGRAEAFMADIAPEAEEITAEVSAEVRFRDCGANLESVSCRVCNVGLSLDWWAEQMGDEGSWDDDFELEPVQLPCGHTVESLNDLRYHFEQRFSRFLLDAMNPNIRQLEERQVKRFEEILGCQVKIIYQHI